MMLHVSPLNGVPDKPENVLNKKLLIIAYLSLSLALSFFLSLCLSLFLSCIRSTSSGGVTFFGIAFWDHGPIEMNKTQ